MPCLLSIYPWIKEVLRLGSKLSWLYNVHKLVCIYMYVVKEVCMNPTREKNFLNIREWDKTREIGLHRINNTDIF